MTREGYLGKKTNNNNKKEKKSFYFLSVSELNSGIGRLRWYWNIVQLTHGEFCETVSVNARDENLPDLWHFVVLFPLKT